LGSSNNKNKHTIVFKLTLSKLSISGIFMRVKNTDSTYYLKGRDPLLLKKYKRGILEMMINAHELLID
jgi:hypothetical protein